MVGKVTPNDQLSASEIPVLMGASRFKTVNELLKEKIDVINGGEIPFISNEAMTFGNLSEPMILTEAANRLGLKNPKIDYDKPFFHKALPFACSLDGTVEGDGRTIMTDIERGIICVNADEIKLEGTIILEAKLTSHDVENASELPLYRGPLQLQMQIDTVDQGDVGVVCVLYKGTTLKLFVYKKDAEVLDQLHTAIIDFQRRLEKYKTNEEVEWYNVRTPEEASKIWDRPEDIEVMMPGLEKDAEKIIELRQIISDVEDQVKALEVKIMDNMRDYSHAISGRYRISWPTLNYKAQPEKVTPAKPARTIRQSKLRIRDREL